MKMTFILVGLTLSTIACGSSTSDNGTVAVQPTPTPIPPAVIPSPAPSATPVPRGPGQLYALLAGTPSGQILHFSNTGTLSGQVTPVGALSGAATTLGALNDLDVDPIHDRLFVANAPGSILVWDNISTRTGNTPPDRIMSLGLNPVSLSYDAGRDTLYVGGSTGVFRYYGASTANGTLPSGLPIFGTSLFPFNVQIDSVTNRLFVASCSIVGQTNTQVVARYDNAFQSSGDAVISDSITAATNPFATAVDSSGRLVINDAIDPFVPGIRMSTQERILAVPQGSNTPTATITGAAAQVGAHRLNYDFANDSLVVANTNKVLFFDHFGSASGTIPASTARSLDLSEFTGLTCTRAAVDPTR